MPVRRGGAQYVPYSVFSGTLGISGSYNSSDQVLTLSNGETSCALTSAAVRYTIRT